MTEFDYFVSGPDIPGIVYHVCSNFWKRRLINHSHVTIADFQKSATTVYKNGDHNIYGKVRSIGEFHVDPVAHEIREYFPDGSYEVVANSGI
jgi:hypothetical protein